MAACGQTWRDSEVEALIDVWLNKTIQRLLGSTYRNEPIFGKIEQELSKRGVVRGWKQCRDKIKALRGKYKEIMDKLRRSGAGIDSDDEDLHIVGGTSGLCIESWGLDLLQFPGTCLNWATGKVLW